MTRDPQHQPDNTHTPEYDLWDLPQSPQPTPVDDLYASRQKSGVDGESILEYYRFLDGPETSFTPTADPDPQLDDPHDTLGFDPLALEDCEADTNLPRPSSVEGFKAALRAEAHRRLDCTVTEILTTLDKYADADSAEPQSQRSPQWENLQRVLAYDRQLASKQNDYMMEAAGWQKVLTGNQYDDCDACHYADPATLSQDSLDQAQQMAYLYSAKAQFCENLRNDVRADHPEFSLLGDTANSKGAHLGEDAELYDKMDAQGQSLLDSISEIRERIDNGDMPLSKLEPVLETVKAQYDISHARAQQGDALSELAMGWVDNQRNWEFAIEIGGAIIGGVLGVVALGCLFVPGGWAATAAIVGTYSGAIGAGVGLAAGLYSLERANDLALAAEVGDDLLADPEAAKWQYTIAKLNMALAVIDTVLSIADFAKLQHLKALNAPPPGSIDFARLTPDQKLAIGQSIGYGGERGQKLAMGRSIGYGDPGLMEIGRANTYGDALTDPNSSLYWFNQLPEEEQLRLAQQAREAGSMRYEWPLPDNTMAREGDFAIIGRDRDDNYQNILADMTNDFDIPTNIDHIVGSQTLNEFPDSWPAHPKFYQRAMNTGLWNPTANFAWLEGIVQSQKPVVITEAFEGSLLVDVSTGGKSFTAREVEFLINRGYRWDPLYDGPGGGRLIPPGMSQIDQMPRVP